MSGRRPLGLAIAALAAGLAFVASRPRQTGPAPAVEPSATPRPPTADAAPGLAPAPAAPRTDPCAALRRRVDGTPPDPRAAQAVLAALSSDCLPVVPDAWGQAIAAALCEQPTDPDLAVPAR